MHGEMSDDKALNPPTISNWIFCLILLNRKNTIMRKTMPFLLEIEHLSTPAFFNHIGNSKRNSRVIRELRHIALLSSTLVWSNNCSKHSLFTNYSIYPEVRTVRIDLSYRVQSNHKSHLNSSLIELYFLIAKPREKYTTLKYSLNAVQWGLRRWMFIGSSRDTLTDQSVFISECKQFVGKIS